MTNTRRREVRNKAKDIDQPTGWTGNLKPLINCQVFLDSCHKGFKDNKGESNLKSIIEPIAKDNGSQLFIQNCDNIIINLNRQEAKDIQKSIKREEEKTIKEFITGKR